MILLFCSVFCCVVAAVSADIAVVAAVPVVDVDVVVAVDVVAVDLEVVGSC